MAFCVQNRNRKLRIIAIPSILCVFTVFRLYILSPLAIFSQQKHLIQVGSRLHFDFPQRRLHGFYVLGRFVFSRQVFSHISLASMSFSRSIRRNSAGCSTAAPMSFAALDLIYLQYFLPFLSAQSRNASAPICVTFSGIVIFDSPLHPANAESPILVRLLGTMYANSEDF